MTGDIFLTCPDLYLFWFLMLFFLFSFRYLKADILQSYTALQLYLRIKNSYWQKYPNYKNRNCFVTSTKSNKTIFRQWLLTESFAISACKKNEKRTTEVKEDNASSLKPYLSCFFIKYQLSEREMKSLYKSSIKATSLQTLENDFPIS